MKNTQVAPDADRLLADRSRRLGGVCLCVPLSVLVLGGLLDMAILALLLYMAVFVFLLLYATVRCSAITWKLLRKRSDSAVRSVPGLLSCLLADGIYLWFAFAWYWDFNSVIG